MLYKSHPDTFHLLFFFENTLQKKMKPKRFTATLICVVKIMPNVALKMFDPRLSYALR